MIVVFVLRGFLTSRTFYWQNGKTFDLKMKEDVMVLQRAVMNLQIKAMPQRDDLFNQGHFKSQWGTIHYQPPKFMTFF